MTEVEELREEVERLKNSLVWHDYAIRALVNAARPVHEAELQRGIHLSVAQSALANADLVHPIGGDDD